MPVEDYKNLDPIERPKLQTSHEETYHEEFTKNGL